MWFLFWKIKSQNVTRGQGRVSSSQEYIRFIIRISSITAAGDPFNMVRTGSSKTSTDISTNVSGQAERRPGKLHNLSVSVAVRNIQRISKPNKRKLNK